MKYRYRGGPLDGEEVDTPVGPDGPFDVVRAPMPGHVKATVTDETGVTSSTYVSTKPSHVDYYRTRLLNGDTEYWTFEHRAERERERAAEQQPIEAVRQQLRAVRAEVANLRIMAERDREVRHGLEQEVAELRALIVTQEGRHDRLIDAINCSASVLGVATEYEDRTS